MMHLVQNESNTTSSLNTSEDIIEDIRQGKMVVLMDDEDRENEGDLVMSAVHVRAEDINFMARYGRGLICLTLTRERCESLRLSLMVSETNMRQSTNFTVSIEAAEGVTTGISAADRATTIQAAVKSDACATDIVQPGHIFPLMAQLGGVLTRAGHTEAGCDLARMAGHEPAGVIVEILNEDGSMARRPELEKFAKHHGIKIGTIADLIRYRLEHEKTIERVSECTIPNLYGNFNLKAYQELSANQLHLALVYGDIESDDPVTVRVHVEDPLCDILGVHHEDSGWSLQDAMKYVANEGRGIVVILRKTENSNAMIRRIETFQPKDLGADAYKSANSQVLRTFGVGAQILVDLGVHKMRVLGTPKKMYGLSGFGLEVTEYIQNPEYTNQE